MSLEEVARRIDGARRVMVTCHQRPDGDSTGSMSALAGILGRRGKDVTLYNPDPAPRKLAWLPHIDEMVAVLPPETKFDLTVVVDCGDRKLLGESFPAETVTGPLVVLDHHAASRPFGELYVCDPAASSIGVMVARLARIWSVPLEPEWGLGIYVSMVEDTGSFRYSNTNVEAFELATEVVRGGVDPWAVTEKLHESGSVAKYKLLASALGTLELHHGGRIATLKVTKKMVRDAGAKWHDAEGIVNYARGIEGVECGVLLRPTPDGGTYVSLRSKGRLIDAGEIAMTLGGGGHRGAAGCVMPTVQLGDAKQAIVATLGQALGVEVAEPAPPPPPEPV